MKACQAAGVVIYNSCTDLQFLSCGLFASVSLLIVVPAFVMPSCASTLVCVCLCAQDAILPVTGLQAGRQAAARHRTSGQGGPGQGGQQGRRPPRQLPGEVQPGEQASGRYDDADEADAGQNQQRRRVYRLSLFIGSHYVFSGGYAAPDGA